MEELKDFKCPNCGGNVSYDGKNKKLKCSHCDGTFDIDDFESDKGWKVENQNWDNNNLYIYECKSCGGQILAEENTAATSCPYCGNPVVVLGNLSGAFKPKRIIPFKISKDEALKAFENHFQRKLFLPTEFVNSARIEKIQSLFVPYWLFNGTANVSASFTGEKVLSTWRSGDYKYVKHGVFRLWRSGRASFSNIPVDASKNLSDSLTRALEPFDFSELTDFKDVYLSGFLADKYDLSANEVEHTAHERMVDSTTDLLRSYTYDYGLVSPVSSSSSVLNGTKEYVMLPVWVLSVKYKDKNYIYAMNGQTGKFVGELPIDKAKAFLYPLCFGSGIFALLYALQLICWLMR